MRARRGAPGIRFAFIAHNKSEFSAENDYQKPRTSNLRTTSPKPLYFINLGEALRRVEPSLVTDILIEQF